MPGRKGMRTGGFTRKPTALHILQGSYRKDRHGDRLDTIPAVGLPTKPAGLSGVQNGLWDAIVTTLPDGILGRLDTFALTGLVRFYGLYLHHMDKLQEDPTDAATLRMALRCWDTFYRLGGEFGLTPAARARLQAPPKIHDDDDPFQQMLDRLGGG